MSELMSARSRHKDFHWQLLASASALALLACAHGVQAADSDSSQPTIWIELGGQLERQTGQGDVFAPPFIADDPTSPAYKPISPLHSERPPLFSNGAEGKVTFNPEGTDWVFSGSVRYGRSNGSKNAFHQTAGHRLKVILPSRYEAYTPSGYEYTKRRCCKTSYRTANPAFADTQVKQNQSHAVVDFQAGRDVGLGMFGRSGTSVISAGVRFAQFVSKMSVKVQAVPDPKFYETASPPYQFYRNRFHTYNASAHAEHSFHGIGPSISWDASVPFLGNPQLGELTFDWGANAALLFGRQRASGAHQTNERGYRTLPATYQHSASFDRAKAVTIPDAGGFAGVSFRFQTAKISLGYRGDFFFGAMDAGMDTRKEETVGFYGPFATVSVGLP